MARELCNDADGRSKMGSTAIALALGALATGTGAPVLPAQASIAPSEQYGVSKSYDIPPGSMGSALNAFAVQNGLHLLYDAHVTRHLKTPGLKGAYSIRDGLDRLLFGSGLTYRFGGPDSQSVSIILAQAGRSMNDASPRGAQALPPIEVGAARAPREASPRGGGGTPSHSTQASGRTTGKDALGGRLTGYNPPTASSALKTDTPIMKTPVAVQVVTRQTMDDQQAISVRDAIVSNASSVQPTPNFTESYKIRGFTNTGNSYKNGLLEYRMQNLDTTNLQSIEVLKGPAAMLYGRVEPGGIINLVVKRPTETPYYSIQEQVGSYGLTRTTVDATGAAAPDKTVLYRFNGEFYRNDSYRNFVTERNVFLAPTVTLRPNEQFRINFDFEYQHRTYVDDYPLIPAIGGYPAAIPISRYLQAPRITTFAPREYDKKRFAYDWTYDITPDWSLTNRLAYSIFHSSGTNIVGGATNQVTGVLSRTLTNNTTFGGQGEYDFATNLDLKGKLVTGVFTHSTLLGVDYLKTHTPLFINMFVPITTINIYAPNYFVLDKTISAPQYIRQDQKWTGVYGQDMISVLNDSVHLLLGARYDWAETGGNTNLSSYWSVDTTYGKVYNKAFSPKIGLLYQPLPWISLYGNFTRSFGLNNGTTLGMPLPPQRGEQFEGGVKAELLDKRLTATLAYYDITKTNITTPDPVIPNLSNVVGKARSQGFEFDLTGRIDDNWSVIANYSHDDVRTIQGATVDPVAMFNRNLAVAGKVLAASPRNYGNLWVKFDADGVFHGLSLAGGVNVVERSFGDNANSFILPGYALLNGMVSYTTIISGVTITAQLNAKNITDVTYYPTSTGRTTIQSGTPRTFLGSLRVEF